MGEPGEVSVLQVIARQISNEVEANREKSFVHNTHHPFAVFDCITEPSVSMEMFLKRVTRGVTDVELVQAMILVVRLCRKHNILLSCYNAHRLLLSALILSVKLQRNVVGVAKHFCRATGVPSKCLVESHHLFFSLMEGDLFVSGEEFHGYWERLSKDTPEPVSPLRTRTSPLQGMGTPGLHRMVAAVNENREREESES
eukprot:Hpha_TRINITY_DN16218_c2_g2::TRINITY_DN16218_c2_g2_i1::g.13163::m.13163